jgi:hypothetical protein
MPLIALKCVLGILTLIEFYMSLNNIIDNIL